MGAAGAAMINTASRAIFGSPEEEAYKYDMRRNAALYQARDDLLRRATELADRPYEAYRGQRVAGTSRNEQQASELARTGSNQARGYLDQAGKKISALKTFDQADLEGYTNPYVDAVLTPQLRELNRQYERDRTSLLNSKAGAWGGDRVAFMESELGRRHGELISDITARAHSDAFDRATQLWSADQDRQLRAAEALRAVGGDVARLNRDQIQDLMATGGVERLLRQAELDFDYSQFLENRDWSVSNLEPLLRAIGVASGVPFSSPQGQVSTAGGWGQALGAATTLAGMFFGGSGRESVTPISNAQWQEAYASIPMPGDLDVGL